MHRFACALIPTILPRRMNSGMWIAVLALSPVGPLLLFDALLCMFGLALMTLSLMKPGGPIATGVLPYSAIMYRLPFPSYRVVLFTLVVLVVTRLRALGRTKR